LSLKKELKPLQSLAVSAISLSKRVQNKCFYFETPNKNKVYFQKKQNGIFKLLKLTQQQNIKTNKKLYCSLQI